jgi:twitching motility two-component system response regulator PilH
MASILLVEDSQTEAELVIRSLRQAGLTVINARDGIEAQAHLKSSRPDLVILDVILPGQSGFELCRELKTNPSTQQIPVVICSSKDTEVDKMWGDMLGANAYLTKPVNVEELVKTVQGLIRR